MPPTPEQITYGQTRDRAADAVAHTRQAWHDAKTAADDAMRHARELVVLEERARLEHADALAYYETCR